MRGALLTALPHIDEYACNQVLDASSLLILEVLITHSLNNDYDMAEIAAASLYLTLKLRSKNEFLNPKIIINRDIFTQLLAAMKVERQE